VKITLRMCHNVQAAGLARLVAEHQAAVSHLMSCEAESLLN
jgi:hypothetical protein